jgi:NhaP-type Na+/H+ or K+/H+ antiporter
MILHINLRLEAFNVITALLAGYVVFSSFLSLLIKERIYLSETLVATLFGILIGPAVLNSLDLKDWGLDSFTILHQFSRLIIAIQVMIVGVSLPKYASMHQLTSIGRTCGRRGCPCLYSCCRVCCTRGW